MSFSLFVREVVAGLCLLVATPAVVFSQNSFIPKGGEYPIATPLPGDQLFSRLSINAGGGYLVWQDNRTDGDGLGISGLVLDSHLRPALAPFRINQYRKRDQENPQVSLLNSGGAVFVWQGGRQGFQHVYARFLSSSNTWLGNEILVNSDGNYFQVNPVAATLANGNVVVIWASENQVSQGSMRDVYGQILSPTGARVGAEFLVNSEVTAFNQRTPAVAALANGGFVVAWVSEQQRTIAVLNTNQAYAPQDIPIPSVDIYARTYDAAGTPGTMVPINEDPNVCANPSIAVDSDNGFSVAWSQKDLSLHDNGWDVFSKAFSIAGPTVVPRNSAQRINTQLYGDQFAPKLSSIGIDYLAVWTSMGQDGSFEGVYGQFLASDGSHVGGEFQVNTSTLSKQKLPAVASDGAARFLVGWSGFVASSISFDVFAQCYAPANYVDLATTTNYGAPTFVADVVNQVPPGSEPPPLPSSAPHLNFPAYSGGTDALPNGFALAQGSYNGLFAEVDGLAAGSSGFFTATTTANGGVSAKVLVAGRSYSLSGTFDQTGLLTKNVPRKGMSSLTVSLQLDLSGGDQIRGTIGDGSWTSQLLADRLIFDKKKNPTSLAGKYTFAIPGVEGQAGSPGGDSFGTMTVDAGGRVTLAGTLADGTKLSQSSAISKQGIVPCYASLYTGGGAVLSWLEFANAPETDFSGQWIWMKPASAAAKFYPAGFLNDLTALGSLYTPPPSGARAVNIANGMVTLSGGELDTPLLNAMILEASNKVTDQSGHKLVLSIKASTGLFTGTVLNPATGKPIAFQGAVLEKANQGAGFFLGVNQSGKVNLSPAP